MVIGTIVVTTVVRNRPGQDAKADPCRVTIASGPSGVPSSGTLSATNWLYHWLHIACVSCRRCARALDRAVAFLDLPPWPEACIVQLCTRVRTATPCTPANPVDLIARNFKPLGGHLQWRVGSGGTSPLGLSMWSMGMILLFHGGRQGSSPCIDDSYSLSLFFPSRMAVRAMLVSTE